MESTATLTVGLFVGPTLGSTGARLVGIELDSVEEDGARLGELDG